MKRDQKTLPRIRRYFLENTDEVLSFDDIAIKFGCTREQARHACMHLRSEGVLLTMTVAMVNPDRVRK